MFSTAFKNAILDHITGQETDIDFANQVYMALSTADPLVDGSAMAEPDFDSVGSNGYARLLVGDPNYAAGQLFDDASGGAITNSTNPIMFPEVLIAWGTITHFAMFSAAIGGTYLGSGVLTTPLETGAGDVPLFRKSTITWSITDA